jgi:hypothetical protein
MVVVSMAVPFLSLWWALRQERKAVEEKFKKEGKEVPRRCFMEKQAKMGVYDQDAQINDYLSCVTVIGYVILFGAAVPVSAVIALIVLLFQFRANAYRLTKLARRPYPTMCQGIGKWNDIIDMLSWIGLIFYVGVPILNCHLTEELPRATKMLALFLAEHAVVIVKLLSRSLFSAEPKEARLLHDRRSYAKDALLIGKDDPEGLKDDFKKSPFDFETKAMTTLDENSAEWDLLDQIPPLGSPFQMCSGFDDLTRLLTEAENDKDRDECV